MKTLFISDIHGNLNNLSKLNLNEYNEIICLGDIYSYSSNVDEEHIIDNFFESIKYKTVCLKGNCDIYNDNIFTPNKYIKYYIDDIPIICTHGDYYGYGKGFPKDENGILIYGHEHVPYIKKIDNRIYICVGSISRPRQNSQPSYMVYENNTFTIYSIDGNVIDSIKIKSKA